MSTDAINKVLVGLVRRGCSCAEALDYYMVEVGPHSQTSWAEERGVSQQTVSENISKARTKMVDE